MIWNLKRNKQVVRWFAWHPIVIGSNGVWLEWVWRSCHMTPYGGFYEYGFNECSFDKNGFLQSTNKTQQPKEQK